MQLGGSDALAASTLTWRLHVLPWLLPQKAAAAPMKQAAQARNVGEAHGGDDLIGAANLGEGGHNNNYSRPSGQNVG
jgi:hypothetical protein